jgi:anti-sigma factor RsiW
MPADLLRGFEEHLAACPRCRQEVEELQSLLDVIEKPLEVTAPPRLYHRIREQLPDLNRTRVLPWWKPVLVPVLATAAFILTAFASVQLVSRVIAQPSGPQVQVTSATMDLSVFNDAPQTSLAAAYNRLTGE